AVRDPGAFTAARALRERDGRRGLLAGPGSARGPEPRGDHGAAAAGAARVPARGADRARASLLLCPRSRRRRGGRGADRDRGAAVRPREAAHPVITAARSTVLPPCFAV